MCPYYGIVPPARRNKHTCWGGDVQNVPQVAMPPFMNRSYTITADLIVPADGAEGGSSQPSTRVRQRREAEAHLQLPGRRDVQAGIKRGAADGPERPGAAGLRGGPGDGDGRNVVAVDRRQKLAKDRMACAVPIVFSPTPAWTAGGTTVRWLTRVPRVRGVRVHRDDREGRLRHPAAGGPGRRGGAAPGGGRDKDRTAHQSSRGHDTLRGGSRCPSSASRSTSPSAPTGPAVPLDPSVEEAVLGGVMGLGFLSRHQPGLERSSGQMKPSPRRKPPPRAMASRSGTAQ